MFGSGERERELAADTGRALHCEVAVMEAHDPAGNGKSKAGSGCEMRRYGKKAGMSPPVTRALVSPVNMSAT